jgi:hypothetical protein
MRENLVGYSYAEGVVMNMQSFSWSGDMKEGWYYWGSVKHKCQGCGKQRKCHHWFWSLKLGAHDEWLCQSCYIEQDGRLISSLNSMEW